ncbi:DEAD/DEAH box helicase [Anaerotalea alkaliphila]|uniref:DEAD/DEAH box helicase n=1 Tax=Anaerotalea alkaliphila TaxID=2662126 RepID=A0A7X5HWJ6_9FIRM|nr:DEAD/DEAH box helicase [Anaerotalea alkaliphila]NDL67989.1 DEAD/DEAH box helicase [Anaerotalea alkaliphila]
MNYQEMNVSDAVKQAVRDMGFTEPTEIQEKGIPLIQSGVDVIGQSQTGTGKTAAFAIPILDKIDPELEGPQVLVICPTRELSVQVSNEFQKLAKYMQSVKVTAVYGGDPIRNQIMALRRGVKVVVGTPGRTIDHINRRTLKLDNVHTVILDEADEMLKMGFREDIELILSQVKPERQTILFSATMPKTIIDITKKYQKDPAMIQIKATGMTTATVKQEYCQVKEVHKPEALGRILDAFDPKRCIVFCNTKNKVDDVTEALQARGYMCEKIHGDLKQELRLNVLRKFNEGIVNVLIATDVAARGLDIKGVDLVVNFDVPDKEDYYVHRIGRSGRAGKEGHSMTLVSKREVRLLQNIRFYIKKDIERVKIPTIAQVNEIRAERYIDTLVDAIGVGRHARYEDLIETIEARGVDLRQIAAHLLKNVLELSDVGEHEDINELHEERRPAYDGKARTDRKTGVGRKFEDRRSGGGKQGQGRVGMSRLFINVGKSHNAMARDIVGAVAGESGIPGSHIGSIDMFDKYSFIDVLEKDVAQVLRSMQDKRIRGRRINIEEANAAQERR